MDSSENFTQMLSEAIQKKSEWFDTAQLPKLLDSYRNIKGYMTNFTSVLNRKGFIQPDPYKHEKKVTAVKPIEDTPFLETERSSIIGTRLSDYDNMLDFITSYVRFNSMDLTLDQIKRLNAFNNTIAWNSFTNTSSKPTTKVLAEMVNSIRSGSDSMSINMMNDIISLLGKEFSTISSILKDFSELQKESYKLSIRTNVLESSDFTVPKAGISSMAAMGQIKKIFSQVMGKQPFYAELVTEVIAEEFGPQKDKYKKDLIAKLAIPKTQKKKETNDVSAHETVMGAVRLLGSVASQFEIITQKLDNNKQLLESQHNNVMKRIMTVIRKAFKLQDKPIEYRVSITENVTKTTRAETVNIQSFIADIAKRAKMYASFSVRKNPGYQKLDQLEDIKILEFLNKQLSECQKILILITALDTFFKASINSPQIKGMKIEISAIKGILHKTAQQKAEYAIIAQEQEQMKKLGIKHDL